jgi:hypothetical protein
MAIVRKGMRANPDLLLYAGSPQFEPESGTIVGGYGAVHVRQKHNPNWKAFHTQHGAGRFLSFADDGFAGDEESGVVKVLSDLGKGFIVLAVMGVAAVLLSPKK